jgi:Phage P22-like portal protein
MDDIVKEAREAIALSYDFDRDNRRAAAEDLRFIANDQWSAAARRERAGRPIITINRSSQFLRQVSNPIRQNMPTLKVEPDGDADLELAEVANGLFRRIQYNSSASHVYANAVEHMVGCGIGWFRIMSDYADDESFDQELKIKRVFNPMSVYPDPSSMEPDRSDMNWCVVSELMPRKAFEQRWKGKSVEGMDTPSNSDTNGGIYWGSTDSVRVAEFWRRKEVPKELARLKDGRTVNITDMPKQQLSMLQQLGMIEGTRKAKGYKVEMHLLSGSDVLEDPYECPCKWIPLVPVIGAEVPLEQGIYRHGLIRFQREPQQLYNYFMSVAAESLGQQPKSPYLATPKQIGKHKSAWNNAATSATPYLLYEPDASVPGGAPTRVAPPPLPAGLIQMAQMLADDMKATTGIYDAALGQRSNETSGVAIQGRVEQGNNATSHFVDNLQHALEHTGRILLDMIPKIYDTARTLRMMGEDGSETEARINQPMVSEYGEPQMENDLSQMSFKSVRVIMGPSYASKRAEAVQQLTSLIQAMPELGAISGDIIARNLDFDGSEELAKRAKLMLPPGILQMENPDQAPPPPPDPMEDPVVRSNVELNMARANLANAQAQAAGMPQQQGQEFEDVDPAQDANVATAHAKAQQEQFRVEEARHRVDGAALDNALKVKKLREPTPQPPRPGQKKTPARSSAT